MAHVQINLEEQGSIIRGRKSVADKIWRLSPATFKCGRATTATERSGWVRRHLSGSIYLWACGEKAGDEDDEPKVSDSLIGWLVLLIQGILYAVLFHRAGNASSSNTGIDRDSEQRGYPMTAIFAAMYLLVATTLPDLRAGFSLVGNGVCAGHRFFGIGLLVVYGLMVSTAMKVLTASSDDDATVVLTAVLVLFVADLDAKALTFFSSVPTKWRLFWVLFSVWISFLFALVAAVYVGDFSDGLDVLPSWFYLVVSPAAAVLCSYVLSNAVRNFLDSSSEASESSEGVRNATDRCFYRVRALWLVGGGIGWLILSWFLGIPLAFDVPIFQIDEGDGYYTITLTTNMVTMVFSVAVLITGLAFKGCGSCLPRRQERTAMLLGETSSPDSGAGREGCWSCTDARVPSLLVGWGVGYWVTSLLYVLAGAWHGGGWSTAPIVVTIAGYVVLPCFLFVGMLTMTETNLLGERLGAFVKPAVDALKDKRRVWYWIMATVLRDVLLLWVLLSVVLIAVLSFPN